MKPEHYYLLDLGTMKIYDLGHHACFDSADSTGDLLGIADTTWILNAETLEILKDNVGDL